ncbi:MAX gene-associated protein isoform X4 [Hippocampus comes]|uniref:MAX gene-associated protein isoform X4 n=1 Tax=Hippocampus comes TaxID=109280 RepID=UPI00094E5D2E|nr:PREDICTED: MAX gene-associated protein-like isoform X4 [Hippocampus comes]
MPATHPQPVSMQDQHVEEGPMANVPISGPVTTVLSSTPPSPTTAISVASTNKSVTSLHSPAEASPAKPTVALPTVSGMSPAGSHIASASDSPAFSVSITKSAVVDFGHPNPDDEQPNMLMCKGVSVTLENDRVWKQFHSCGTEMILTKQGRRMFPYCRYRLAGLDPERHYSLMLSIVPSDKYKYRWNSPKWEVVGPAEYQAQVAVRAFPHHYSPCRGSDLMGSMLSFYKLKVTNNPKDLEGHIILTSMHRYIPQLHVIPLSNDITTPPVMGPESLTFTFPQTEFMAVTTYQNFLVTQLKINHNPFAKGFREDRFGPNLSDVPVEKLQLNMEPPEEQPEIKPVDQSLLSADSAYLPTEQESNLVLKPITFSPTINHDPVTQCVQGRQAVGDLRIVLKRSLTKGDNTDDDKSPSKRIHIETPKKPCVSSALSVQRTLCRRHNNRNGHWSRLEGGWKSATLRHAACGRPSASVTTEPELDEVEGLTFVSFATREALESHIRAEPSNKSLPVSPDSSLMTPTQQMKTDEATPETTEEKIGRLEAILLQDLKVAKYRQVIHPVLEEVGLKLSSLDPSKPIDLLYLGVCLPLPPFNHDSEGLTFISRTGKTSDVTKIKGWKNKFVQSKQPSDGSQKNLSAFCSNMLDEYLESEAQQISERAAAFSTGPEAPVAYQLPAKSASYVKTLDSVLKHRKTPAGINNKPCPLSFKPLLYAALTSPPPYLARTPTTTMRRASNPQRPTQASRLMTAIKSTAPPIVQQKLLEMEDDVVSQGCTRTCLTPTRVSASLAVMLTKETLHQQAEKSPPNPLRKMTGPECRQEFCRLGCVCFSLSYPVVGPLHCRQPACMFGCACSKRTTQDSWQQDEVNSAGTSLEHKSCSTSQSNKLWNRNIFDADPDPLFQPKSQSAPPVNPLKPYMALPRQQIQEEDKDPVYKYLESFLTCARVRPFKSKPPSQNTIDYIPTLATNSKKHGRAPCEPKKQENTVFKEKLIKKQIEIQSVCRWEEDREMILETLCTRLNQDKLSEPFNIGPYLIHPVTKIFIQKPSGSNLTYRVRVSRPANVRVEAEEQNSNEDALDPTEEKRKQPVWQSEVKPFLGGVLPAGLMVARTKPVSSQTSELIQVNGKSYSYVNLLLGSMGSLHPANRLAAYATGRLQRRSDLTRKVDHAPITAVHKVGAKPDNQNLNAKPAIQNLKATGRLMPIAMPAKDSTDVQTHPLIPLLKQQCVKKDPESPMGRQLAPLAAINPFQRSSRSTVSLTVSPSLKTPSFLSQSGTYSFRICPPCNPSKKDKNCPSVTLPGGFTLIRLPKSDKPNDPTNVVAQQGTTNKGVPVAINGTQGTKDEQPICSSEDCESSLSDDSADHDSDVDSTVDIETIEESKQELAIARLKEVAQSKSPELCTGKLENPRTRRRRNHSVTEKQRRLEQRALFYELQNVLGQPGGSKLHLLSMALKEIHMLRAISDGLLERKKKLAQIQAIYLKKLSCLTGKPEELIKGNLDMIFSRLKDKGGSKAEPFFMRLYQSKKEHAKDATSPPPPVPTTLLLPSPPPKPSPQLLPLTPPPLSEVPERKSEGPSLPPPTPQKLVPPAPKPNDAAAPAVSASPAKEVLTQHAQQFTIPLIRSKTGRLILPSSMKPGQGIYTLMLMNPNQDADVTTQSSSTDSTIPLDLASPPDAAKPINQYSPEQKAIPTNGLQSVSTAAPGKQVPRQSNLSASATRRPRGRPRKGERILKRKEKPDEDETFIPNNCSNQPMKRRRGRPRKSEPFASPEYTVGGGASRPRTRGSLGKDFPSAKRQSWIDIEMELDHDSDSE